jgi:CO dehydrogenase maturation factor
MDNEAGLEHLSRRTTRSADVLLVVSEATAVGLKTAKRVSELVKELDIKTGRSLLLINRYSEPLDHDKIKNLRLDYIGNIPPDQKIAELSLNGDSLWKLKDDTISINALRKLGEKIWQPN